MNKQPNLFFIGAMRSGSTSVHLLLDQHPQIFMTQQKEPMFYIAEVMRQNLQQQHDASEELEARLSKFVSQGNHRERSSYEALFQESSGEKYVGESSHYLYIPKSAGIIHHDCPEARIIISIRNPVDRLFSEYLLYRREGRVHSSFLEFARKGCTFDSNGALIEIGKGSKIRKGSYSSLIAPWISKFGREQVKVVLFDDVRADPIYVIKEIYHWLGVDSEFTPRTVHVQPGGVPKSNKLFNLVKRPGPIKKLLKDMLPKEAKMKLRANVYSFFLNKPEIDQDARVFLKQVYAKDVEKLEELLEINLSSWK